MKDNKLIAEFMGNLKVYHILIDPDAELETWRHENGHTVSFNRAKQLLIEVIKEGNSKARIEMDTSCLKFHSSWNWLIPVVEKIEKLDCVDYVQITGGKGENEIITHSCHIQLSSEFGGKVIQGWYYKDKHTEVYKAVVEFTKGYKRHKKIIKIITDVFNEISHAEKAASILYAYGVREADLQGIQLEDTKKISIINALRYKERRS